MSSLATLHIETRLARLTLNRPEACNALSLDLLAALHERLGQLEANRDVQVVVITGAGTAFCAGMDLKQVLGDPGAPERLLRLLAEFTIRLRALPAVVVGAVNGAAIGGGCGIACVCDLTVTHSDSKMGFPEVDLGICPAVVAPWLVRKIGAGRARQVLLSGGLITGQRAFELGIVTDVVPSAGELDARVSALIERLLTGGPDAVRATKNLLNELDGSSDPASVLKGADLSAAVIALPETQKLLRDKLGL
ncbi:MAG: enoyl-CoA hydratase/isomerase family protein [Phycisphaerales bacterium]|nr:enoyl-CoA hydratase/isomerase family protein [Phycisphaerales bacterium]